jgi:hypothetical protein
MRTEIITLTSLDLTYMKITIDQSIYLIDLLLMCFKNQDSKL